MGSLTWWLLGHGLAFGKDWRGFVGTDSFALKGKAYGTDTGDLLPEGYATWLFQWAFAATATTIVSGAMAERATFGSYVLHSSLLMCLICEFGVFAGGRGEGGGEVPGIFHVSFGFM